MKKAFWHYKAPQFGGGGSEIYKSSVWRIPKKDRLQLWLQRAAAEAQGLVSSRPFAEIWWFQAGSGASLWTRIAVTEKGFNARSPSVMLPEVVWKLKKNLGRNPEIGRDRPT